MDRRNKAIKHLMLFCKEKSIGYEELFSIVQGKREAGSLPFHLPKTASSASVAGI